MRAERNRKNSIRKEWDNTPDRGILPDEIKSRMWRNIQRATHYKSKRRYRWMVAASITFLLSIAGYQAFYTPILSSKVIVATKTFPQDIRILHLPDGTRVWVNQNTEIAYPQEFATNQRTVTLKGEAFFEVAKDPSKPFVISSGAIKTTVLGTSFNIKAYEGLAPEVSVRTGKVKVEGSQNTVFLEKGYAGVLIPENKTIQKQKTKTLEPEWKKLMVDMDGLTLVQVIEQLQPLYAFEVEYKSEELKNLKIQGTLDTRQGPAKMLRTIAFALEINIKPIGMNRYVITK